MRQGIPLQTFAPGQLETLAGLVGNSGMEALLERQWTEPRLTSVPLFGTADTEPYPVPELPVSLAEPVFWTDGFTGQAFDPAALL